MAQSMQHIQLADRKIEYQLTRSRRKSIGIRISHCGVQVCAPMGLSLSEIDQLVKTKARWIQQKLTEWNDKKPLKTFANNDRALYPLLGDLWKPGINAHGQVHMALVPGDAARYASAADDILKPASVQKWIAAWYQQHAIACFSERLALYAGRLNIAKPQFKLSHAKTRWGSCNSRGVIRLNWRLIQLPLRLIDYVVAHELCHLIEMNHSPAFWRLVAGIFPDYQQARRELNTYAVC